MPPSRWLPRGWRQNRMRGSSGRVSVDGHAADGECMGTGDAAANLASVAGEAYDGGDVDYAARPLLHHDLRGCLCTGKQCTVTDRDTMYMWAVARLPNTLHSQRRQSPAESLPLANGRHGRMKQLRAAADAGHQTVRRIGDCLVSGCPAWWLWLATSTTTRLTSLMMWLTWMA